MADTTTVSAIFLSDTNKSFYIFNKEALMEVPWLEGAQKK